MGDDIFTVSDRAKRIHHVVSAIKTLAIQLQTESAVYDALINKNKAFGEAKIGFNKTIGAGRASVSVRLKREEAEQLREFVLNICNRRLQEINEKIENLAKEL